MNYLNELFASLSAKMGGAFANIMGALLFLIIGLLLAKFIRNIVRKLMTKTKMEERLG